MSTKRGVLIAFSLLLFCSVEGARAEVICRAGISYKWKRGADEKGAEIEVHWADIEKVAPDEESGKASVTQAAASEKAKAESACKRDHENLAGCIASKHTSMNAVLQNLGFASRKALEDAINTDCKQQQGTCAPPVLGEIKCAEKKVEGADGEGEEEKGGKGGEEGKGKK